MGSKTLASVFKKKAKQKKSTDMKISLVELVIYGGQKYA